MSGRYSVSDMGWTSEDAAIDALKVAIESGDGTMLSTSDAVSLLERADTMREVESVLALVRPRDRAKAIRTASKRRDRREQRRRRAEWVDVGLPGLEAL